MHPVLRLAVAARHLRSVGMLEKVKEHYRDRSSQ